MGALLRSLQDALLRSPDAVAIYDPTSGEAVTYDGLRARAEEVSVSNGSGGLVGLAVDEGIDMVVLMVACLLRGVPFVPIDTRNWPPRRVEEVVEGLGVANVLREVVCGPSPTFSTSTAYVISTSGSTGSPKYVIASHDNVLWYAEAKGADEGIDKQSRVLLASHFTFDPCEGDVFTTLLHSATLVVSPRAVLTGGGLYAALAVSQATHVCCTPTHWAMCNVSPLPYLRCVSLGGEHLPPHMASAWAPRVTLRNLYGVTEATVYQTRHIVAPGDSPAIIGTPYPGCEVCLLNEHGDEVEEGEVGEICISGKGVAARVAFLGPTCTVDDPPALHRTGDRGVVVSGVLTILGRMEDGDLVKVSGMRVAPAEVEEVVMSCPLVRTAKIGRGMVAAVVPTVHPDLYASVPTALDVWCRNRLPRHAVPAGYSVSAVLPMTPNGKLDIPKPSLPPPSRPLTASEEIVATAWRQVLQLPDLPPPDGHFVWLGGDSLSALRVSHLLRSEGNDTVAGYLVAAEAPEGAVCTLGDFMGPLAPCELLARPVLSDYTEYLVSEGALPSHVGACATGGPVEHHLLRAARAGCTELLEVLLEHGVHTHTDFTPLHAAVAAGHVKAVQLLAPHYPHAKELVHLAAARGDAAMLAVLDGDLTECDGEGMTCLHLAARSGSVPATEHVLRNCGQQALDALDRSSPPRTALGWAVHNGHMAVARLLVAAGATPTEAQQRLLEVPDEPTGRVKRRARGVIGDVTKTGKAAAARKVEREDRVIEELVRNIGDEDDGVVLESITTLRNLVCAVKGHRTAARRAGVVAALKHTIVSRDPSSHIVAHAAGALRNLAHDAEGRIEIIEAGLIPVLSSLLHQDHSVESVWRAAAALAAVSTSPQAWDEMAAVGCVPIIASLGGRKLGLASALLDRASTHSTPP